MSFVPNARPAQILVMARERSTVCDLLQLLERAGHSANWQPLDDVELRDWATVDLVILEGSRGTLPVCRQLRARLGEYFVPIVLLIDGSNADLRLAGLESGADACFGPPSSSLELLAQVQAFLRLKKLHDRSVEMTAEFHRVNKQLEQAYQQIDQELMLARRIQHSMLPQALPEMPPVKLAVHYQPRDRVGGDFYDAFRLDENHLGFYVADVMGHGVPASLLTIFVKKAVRAKEIVGNQYRLLSPAEVLQQLNRDLIGQAVAENPFITMVYAVFDGRDQRLAFARAGHPYPLYLPRSGEPELWQVHGTLLGVFETQYQVQTRQLGPGDKVVFYTDGLDTNQEQGKHTGAERLLQGAVAHRNLPIQEFVDRLSHDLFTQTALPDDFTLLGLELSQS
jgi:sigma-B regulation protein RsbU (phosphoserine phosphatase)